MNKKRLKFLFPLMTAITLTPAFLISCSREKSNNNQDNDFINSINILGSTQYEEGQSLSLQNKIIWKDNEKPSSNITYTWSIEFSDGTIETKTGENIVIDSISTKYNNAKISLKVSFENYSKQSDKITISVTQKTEALTKVSLKSSPFSLSNIKSIVVKDKYQDNNYFKNLIITNKTTFFNIYDKSFNFETNLVIDKIYENEADSDLGIVFLDITVNNIKNNSNDKINAKIEINGFKTTNVNDLGLLNYDYFVLPNGNPNNISERITLTSTKDKTIINKYGNAPLPWKDDSDITTDDLVNMFNYMCLSMSSRTITFGQRKIDCNNLSDAFVKWLIEYRKYFPFVGFNNPTAYFIGINDEGQLSNSIKPSELNTPKYINETKWYINQILWTNYTRIYEYGVIRDGYLEFITNFFRYLQPNMNDNEKFFLASNYVMNWLWYKAEGASAYIDKGGVCADYANLLSLLLSLIDVPAIPIVSGYQGYPHEIVWVYLDLDGSGTRKWYASDPTNADYNKSIPYVGMGASALIYESKHWILMDVGVSQFEPIDSVIPGSGNKWQRDISNLLFRMPWSNIGQNKSIIGQASYGRNLYLDNDFEYMSNERFKNICKYSRTFYINGYSYYFARNFSSANNGVDLYRTKAYLGSEREKLSIDLPTEYKEKFYFTPSDDRNTSYPPLVQQIGNKIAIILNSNKSTDENYQRSILVLNTTNDGIDWNSGQEFFLPKEYNKKYIFNFDIDSKGNLRLDLGAKFDSLDFTNMETVMLDLGDNFKSQFSFNANNNNRDGDLKIAKQYFSALLNMYRTGENKDGHISYKIKKDFYTFMDDLSTNTPFDSIQKIYQEYLKIIDGTIIDSGEIIRNKLLNDVYYKTQNAFDLYGITFTNLSGFTLPEDMILNETILKYNVYYSSKKPTNDNDLSNFTKIISESNYPKITKADLTSHGINNANGYYYFELIKYKTIIKTNVFELKIQNDDFFVEPSLHYYSNSQPTVRTKITNFNNEDIKWSEESINLEYEFNWNTSLFPSKFKYEINLKYVNLSDPSNIKTLYGNNDFGSSANGRVVGSITISDKPTNDNHGVYYLEIITTNVATNEVSKYYSDFIFIMTYDDYINWDKNIWIDCINTIQKK